MHALNMLLLTLNCECVTTQIRQPNASLAAQACAISQNQLKYNTANAVTEEFSMGVMPPEHHLILLA